MDGNPTKQETEEMTSIWQTGLWNNHIQVERFQLEDDRVIFMFKVGFRLREQTAGITVALQSYV